ncbi:2-phospho-L-lactate guanylyltransferase [Micromonospora viridifaciens]|uniref:Phosphoenolpyruvate guanylyltransferase n=2 Tax=Micromonospora viridifaciens TaxID=1881 RepID=A0A1C4ZIT8_MICVI|nr:2-phospho-L-lactate guanylyltransferase [Micromonospora viridifaciens]
MPDPTWTVVVPVKRLGAAKSRLRGALPGVPHEELALALAADTVRAVRACPAVGEVLVVSDDARVAAEATAAGTRVVADPAAGLNAAFRHGAAVAGPRAAVAGLAADLPALRPAELTAALRAVPAGVRGFVADAPGSGTVLLAAPAGVPLDPRFGVGSAAAHTASGALPLRGDWPTLRRDVDTAADLAAAARLGTGPRTAALLGGGVGYGAGMQGTVATYDASTRSGVLLLDDGTELPFPARAFDASGLRLLRLGQRVRIERDAAGEVVRVTLPTMA